MEKVLDLKMPGVQVLGRKELKEVDGGFIWAIIELIVGAYLTDVALNPSAHAKAFKEGQDMYVSPYKD